MGGLEGVRFVSLHCCAVMRKSAIPKHLMEPSEVWVHPSWIVSVWFLHTVCVYIWSYPTLVLLTHCFRHQECWWACLGCGVTLFLFPMYVGGGNILLKNTLNNLVLNNLAASSSSRLVARRRKVWSEASNILSQMDHFKATFKDHPILVVGGTWSTVLGMTMLYVRQQKKNFQLKVFQ